MDGRRGWSARARAAVLSGAVLLGAVLLGAAGTVAAGGGDDGVSPEVRGFVDNLLAAEKAALASQGFDVDVDATVEVVDFSGDGRIDLVVQFTTPSHCGSGGCQVVFHQAVTGADTPNGPSAWREVYRYSGGKWWLGPSGGPGPHLDILRTAYLLDDSATIVARATWQGARYALSAYHHGEATLSPVAGDYRATRDLAIRTAPDGQAPRSGTIEAQTRLKPMAETADGRWHLILVATGVAGYVAADGLTAVPGTAPADASAAETRIAALRRQAEDHHRAGRPQRAEALYRQALHDARAAQGANGWLVSAIHAELADLYADQGRWGEAIQAFERHVAIYEDRLGPGHLALGAVLMRYAELLRASGRESEAREAEARAHGIYAQTPRQSEPPPPR